MDNSHQNGVSVRDNILKQSQVNTNKEVQGIGTTADARYNRMLDLVRDVLDLELRLKAKMTELNAEMACAGDDGLPAALAALLQHQPIITVIATSREAKKPGTVKVKAKVEQPVQHGGKLRARIVGLMSDGCERKSANILRELKHDKNPTTVYTVLSDLVLDGTLVRTRYAHYRLKMRRR